MSEPIVWEYDDDSQKSRQWKVFLPMSFTAQQLEHLVNDWEEREISGFSLNIPGEQLDTMNQRLVKRLLASGMVTRA